MPLYTVWKMGPLWRWRIGDDWTGWGLTKKSVKIKAQRSLGLI